MSDFLSTAHQAHLDPAALRALEDIIKDQLARRGAEIAAQNRDADVDAGRWYDLAMAHAAQIVALEFKLARGE